MDLNHNLKHLWFMVQCQGFSVGYLGIKVAPSTETKIPAHAQNGLGRGEFPLRV